MGRLVTLGQVGATISYDPVSKMVSWSAPGYTVVQVYVNGTLFAGGESGQASASWVQLGQSYEFKLIGRKEGEDAYLATVTVNANGTVTGQTIYGGEIPPASGGGGGSGTAAPPPEASWFDQSTVILGSAIPNLYFVGGAGALLLFALASRRR